ncbi:MAG: hypothetical protein ABI183_05815 [Polyangiaceae bacterium]
MVLGLESGTPADDADASADQFDAAEGSAKSDGASDSGSNPGSDAGIVSPLIDAEIACTPGTADCNGNPKDGCEQNPNDPNHCGSCTMVCGPMAMCMSSACCIADNGPRPTATARSHRPVEAKNRA